MIPQKTPEITFVQKVRLIKKAGLSADRPIARTILDWEELDSLNDRVDKILRIFKKPKKSNRMIYFIMYDIEDNKVRTQISKYLIKKGCIRIQKSIFLTDSERPVFTEIHKTLKEVNEIYNNNDSIILVPVSTDELRAMKLIGKNVDLALVKGEKNTLFF